MKVEMKAAIKANFKQAGNKTREIKLNKRREMPQTEARHRFSFLRSIELKNAKIKLGRDEWAAWIQINSNQQFKLIFSIPFKPRFIRAQFQSEFVSISFKHSLRQNILLE